MRLRRLAAFGVTVLGSAALAAAIAGGCSATKDQETFPNDQSAGSGGSHGGAGGHGGSATSANGGTGGNILDQDGGPDAPPDVPINPCGTACGPTELCDDAHLGLDDNCNGIVDEGCGCQSGQAHFCFKGDPSYHQSPGCYDGTEKCTENGVWGPCNGGVHATENCFANDMSNCHPILTSPFVTVNLKDGTGNFSANAVPGSEVWTVTCPAGVNPCPGVAGMNPPDDFQPLQSGEYTVTYVKGLAGGGTDTCSYPLFVGARGLRVELEWEHDLGGEGVDLDLHVHDPVPNLPWSIDGAAQDCTWSSCVLGDFAPQSPSAPHWFNDANMIPDPVNWYLDPVLNNNTCYFAPRGVGADWMANGQGCHNPRLDLDDITCDPTVTDPDDFDFCAPENINVDFPPTKTWIRIGVHYYSNHGMAYDIHPRVKIFCDGAQGAELGPTGYYDPPAIVTFAPADGDNFGGGNRFWMVADVLFQNDQCNKGCVVQPIYADQVAKTPLFTTDTAAEASFGPAYPPIP